MYSISLTILLEVTMVQFLKRKIVLQLFFLQQFLHQLNIEGCSSLNFENVFIIFGLLKCCLKELLQL